PWQGYRELLSPQSVPTYICLLWPRTTPAITNKFPYGVYLPCTSVQATYYTRLWSPPATRYRRLQQRSASVPEKKKKNSWKILQGCTPASGPERAIVHPLPRARLFHRAADRYRRSPVRRCQRKRPRACYPQSHICPASRVYCL